MAKPETAVDAAGAPGAASAKRSALPFGLLAYLGAIFSVTACYAQVILSLLAPTLGLGITLREDRPDIGWIDPHVQAVFMWLFGLVAVIGLFHDRKRHHSDVALLVGILGLTIIVGTLYTYYDVRILILGYVLLIVAALLNQNAMLGSLNRTVSRQAQDLEALNRTLERRVERQVVEIEGLARLKRFLAPQVADLVISRGEDSLLESHRRLVAIVFCDVRGFTAFSERVEPEESMNVLRAYHESMGRLVSEHGATIDHRAGDGLMVFFNDPIPCDEPMLQAVKLAVDMRESFRSLNERWAMLGYELGFGVGVSGGYATLGVVGYAGRYDYTANGNAVNLASRLCDEAGDGEILISHKVQFEIAQAVTTASPRSLELKGFGQPVTAYPVLALKDPDAPRAARGSHPRA